MNTYIKKGQNNFAESFSTFGLHWAVSGEVWSCANWRHLCAHSSKLSSHLTTLTLRVILNQFSLTKNHRAINISLNCSKEIYLISWTSQLCHSWLDHIFLLTQTRSFGLMASDIYNFFLEKMVSYQYLISYPMFGELKLEKRTGLNSHYKC